MFVADEDGVDASAHLDGLQGLGHGRGVGRGIGGEVRDRLAVNQDAGIANLVVPVGDAEPGHAHVFGQVGVGSAAGQQKGGGKARAGRPESGPVFGFHLVSRSRQYHRLP